MNYEKVINSCYKALNYIIKRMGGMNFTLAIKSIVKNVVGTITTRSFIFEVFKKNYWQLSSNIFSCYQ